MYIDPAVGEISDIAIFTARTTNNKIGTYNLDFTTKIALAITGQVNPNPALAGERVHFTCNTEGYAEKVTIELWNGEQVELIPDNETNNKRPKYLERKLYSSA
ncbi:hypothetical protein [Caldisalinibacter kiritimatiensis]|uniref:hypothetical protein n=1 Tax=Caldisalinibacter kiritimatiensis TaxID=1304284 RepID=UPI0012DED435|nr:hypothetical protein [Caldisalinibacter kiritimatiensis]